MVLLSAEGVSAVNRVSPLFFEARPIFVATPIAKQLDLHDGQVVQAVVETRQDQLKLVLQGQEIDAPLAPYIKEGDLVQLKAQFSTSGQLIFQMAPALAPAARAMTSSGAQLPTRLNTLLHQPASFVHWVRLMAPGVLEAMIPAGSSLLLQSLRQQQLSMSSLQPHAMREWFMKNAKSTEAVLAEGGSTNPLDIKSLVRQVMAQKDDSNDSNSSHSHENLHHALDEIEASQLRAVQDLQQGHLDFTLVIPFRDAHPVEIQFERKGNKKGQPKNPTIVNMHTDSQVLGEVWLKTSISEGKQVDLTMWATRADVADQAKLNASELTYEIESAGLSLGSFQVFNAARPAPHIEPHSLAHGALIDTKA
jgi:hypothetical protein